MSGLKKVIWETDRGWAAAIANYGSDELYEQLLDQHGAYVPQGEEFCIVAMCGHAHRTPEACEPCFAKLKNDTWRAIG